MEIGRGHGAEVLLIQRRRAGGGGLAAVVLRLDGVVKPLLQRDEVDQADAGVGFQPLRVVVDLVRPALAGSQQLRALGGGGVDPVGARRVAAGVDVLLQQLGEQGAVKVVPVDGEFGVLLVQQSPEQRTADVVADD